MTQSAIPPAVIADAVVAAKAVLRLESAAEDALLGRLCESAILMAEAFCNAAIVTRGFEDVLDVSSEWRRLRVAPVKTIAAVADHATDIDADGIGWVRAAAAGQATISYTAGSAADWGAVPPPLAQGCAMLAAHLFDHREQDGAPPAAVAALWRPFRRMRLAEVRR